MKFSDTFSISRMCSVLSVSRASFYHFFFYSHSSDRISLKTTIMCRILSIFFNSRKTYGSPRITSVLRKEGFIISVKTVGKYMNVLGLVPVSKSNFPIKKNKMSYAEKAKIINLVKGLDIISPNQVWITDITYIKTSNEGWVYLSSILDLFSRKVISWNVGIRMTKELVIETLNNAFASRNYPKGVIVHSDKGSQYRSNAFRTLVSKFNSLYSYTSLNHSCDENPFQESFHATLKKEWLSRFSFNNISDVKRACFNYIEGFYNTNRIHSSLGFLSPNDFESRFFSSNPPLSFV